MYRSLLNEKFFRDNPLAEMSAQRFVYSLLLNEGIEDLTRDFVTKHTNLNDGRRAHIDDEKAMIQGQDDPDAVFQLLRKDIDPLNRPALLQKALEHEEHVAPMVVEKLIRSDHDTFIENAVRILAKSKVDYTGQLRVRYSEVRSPYVKSLACILLGFRASEDVIPWMMDRFLEMRKLYPGENYDQGPLLALHELRARFYTEAPRRH